LYIHIANLIHPNAKRRYGLDIFNINGKIITTLEIIRGLGVVYSVTQIDSRFHNNAFHVPLSTIMLRGFWESEKYFYNVRDVIKQDFRFSLQLDRAYTDTLSRIMSTQSVCLHVRRTDILAEDQKGFVGIEYYRAAIECIGNKVKSPSFYVFSDDIEWCRSNLRINSHCEFVSDDETTAIATPHEFMLMCSCKHFIIANSTLSWWGAWLATNPQKIVIAPRRWLRSEGYWNEKMPHLFYSDDMVPDEWIRI
jgi:hypothetical protein